MASIAGWLLATASMPMAGWGQLAEPTLTGTPGFSVELVADDLATPTGLAFGPGDRLYVALRDSGRVVSMPIGSGLEGVNTVLDGLSAPSQVAIRDSVLWVLDSERLVRMVGLLAGEPSRRSDIPLDSLRAPTTSFALVPGLDGPLVAIAGTCDGCGRESSERGTIVRVAPAGEESEVWASGFRQVGGMAVQPGSGVLWATETGRLDRGGDLPVDELNAIHPGRHYGWPYCFGNRIPTPEYSDRARCDRTEPPAIGFPTGSAPDGIVFYSGTAFPPEYRGDAFVALAGTVNRSFFAGYRVVRVRFVEGRPVAVETFVSGWLDRAGVRGRPTRLAVGPDGALYISDDLGGRIWRVIYSGTSSDGGAGSETRAPGQ